MDIKIGVNLLWVRPGKVGGTESYIRNLLKGFLKYSESYFSFYLFTSLDNRKTFRSYFRNIKFKEIVCNVRSSNIKKRIIWENFNLDRLATKKELDIIFIPVYSKPFFTSKKNKYVTVIHDLQAMHYPEYFSKFYIKWMKLSWLNSIKTSNKIIAISNFVKDDIIDKFKLNENQAKKIEVISNPISNLDDFEEFENISKKYNIKRKEYFYTISSMLPHKNTKTLLYTIKLIKEKYPQLPQKLVVSGISTKGKFEIQDEIKRLGIEKNVILTGYISNKERNTLYKNAKLFLFPSIFEGFGMPPIEALKLGIPTITTTKASIYEVSKGLALYVKDPFKVEEWIEKILCYFNKDYYFDNEIKNLKNKLNEYDLNNVTKKYFETFKLLWRNKNYV